MNKLTEEQIKENLACYEQAMRTGTLDGIEVEKRGNFVPKIHSEFYYDAIYRRKPAPKLVPYDAQTWPLDAQWVRNKESDYAPFRAIEIRPEGIRALISPLSEIISWELLLTSYNLTRDGGISWEPCGRMV